MKVGLCLTPNPRLNGAPGIPPPGAPAFSGAGRRVSRMTDVSLTPPTGRGVLHCSAGRHGLSTGALREAVSRRRGRRVPGRPRWRCWGHKADLGFMALHPDLWRLRPFQTDLVRCRRAPAQSYVSLTELSEYSAGIPDEMRRPASAPASARGQDGVVLLSHVQAPQPGPQLVRPSPSTPARS